MNSWSNNTTQYTNKSIFGFQSNNSFNMKTSNNKFSEKNGFNKKSSFFTPQNMEISSTNDDLKEINAKLSEIKKELDVMKYKESTRHIIHQGIVCNNCNKNNIHGIRFKCFTCQDYNICEDCERYLNYIHDNSHFFIRIHDTSLFNNLVLQQQQQQQQQQKLF